MADSAKKCRASENLRVFASEIVFACGCGLVFAVLCLALPSYFPLLEPDSAGYLTFARNRTAIYPLFLRLCAALGLGLNAIVLVQVGLFAAGVVWLVTALLRWNVNRSWIALMVMLLGTNTYFSSFQRTILSESIGFSAMLAATALLLDYLRTGRVVFIAGSGIFIGLMIGIRPAGLMIAPMLVAAALLMRRARNVPAALLIAATIVPVLIGYGPERVLYRIEHGTQSASVLPYVLTGKAAMLARPSNWYTGPHADALRELNDKLVKRYAPAQRFLAALPSWVAWPVITAFYEGAGQFQVINHDLVRLAEQYNTTPETLGVELGEQTILNNPLGFVRLSLIHYIGQWSVTALTFPPTADAMNAYRESVREIPLQAEVTLVPFTPQASAKSLFVYPAFMIAGLVTLVLALMLPRYLIWPADQNNYRARSLMIAVFFAAMCHSSMLFTSFINVSTPRFLMMIYPHILLALLFLARAWRPNWVTATSSPES